MTVLQLSRAFATIGVAGLFLAAGFGFSRLVEPPTKVVAADSQVLIQKGYEFFDTGDFKNASVTFQAVTDANPENGEAWFMSGMFRHYDKDFAEARACFEKAIKFNYQPGLAHFNIGCGYALLNEKDKAMDQLERAVKAGLTLRSHYATDPDLDNLRNLPEFQALLMRLQHPLSSSPTAVALERRIGAWEVFNKNNQYRGTLRSSMTLNGYGIEEHLANATGLSEQALYLYNASDDTWTCTIANGRGAIGNLKGTFKDGRLQVVGPMTGSAAGMRRITVEFMPEGIIHETHESAPAAGQPFELIDVYTLKPYQG